MPYEGREGWEEAAGYFALLLLPHTKTRGIDKCGRTWYAITIDRPYFVSSVPSRATSPARGPRFFAQTVSNFMCVPRNARPCNSIRRSRTEESLRVAGLGRERASRIMRAYRDDRRRIYEATDESSIASNKLHIRPLREQTS